ncbi:MAG: insulinase family protein [Lachnospiraceae bacterium]|nr:insulinase family protein [Lachnospiraceae bacterium]
MANNFENIKGIKGYELIGSEELEEIKSTGYIFRHIKSQARVVVVSNSDDNKVFSIAFRTPPKDSTGVPHIIEHSVLCGSKKFPPKDPFVELVKGSLNTFLNAMTYPDKTVYPIASCNDKDFQNLMDVYMDAVFFPNIYNRKEIFMQEGWHYELEGEDSELKYNGVVYNEMKGAFSSPEQVLYRNIQHSLFPDTPYGTESGGDPEVIPDLTYEDFLAFHGRYYHPSNSYIYLYGDMDIEEKLTWMDKEYLSKFDKIDIDSSIERQKEFDKVSEEIIDYPISEEESEDDNTYLSYNCVIGTSLDKELCFAFEVLDYVLLGASGAPVRQALLDAGLAKDILGGYDSDIYQPFFSFIAKQTNIDKKDEFVKVVREALQKVIDDGVDEKALRAAINRYEFRHKEADYDRYPKGLIYGLDMLDSWLYDENQPFMRMKLNDTYKFLKEQIGTGYYEKLIKEYLLDNKHMSVVAIIPKAGLTGELDKKTQEKLDEYKSKLTAEEIKELVETTKKLKEYQAEPSTKEELDTIPMLEKEDIKKTPIPIINDIRKIGNNTLVYHDIYTNGIAYFDFMFDLKDIPKTLIPYIGLYGIAIGEFNTENYDYSQIDNEINIATGGMEFAPCVVAKVNKDIYKFFKVSVRTLYENKERTFELLDEIVFKADYHNKKRMKEIVQQTRSRLNMKINSSGHVIAAKRALSYISEKSMFTELVGGIAYYDFICDLDDNFDDRWEVVANVFDKLTRMIFVKKNMVMNLTCDSEGYNEFIKNITDFGDSLPEDCDIETTTKDLKLNIDSNYYTEDNNYLIKKKNEGFKTAGKVQYVARAGNFTDDGYEYSGSFNVLKVILSYDYLWINVRVQGGAYGAMCSFLRDGLSYFTSYRDPQLEKTNQIYEDVVKYIEEFEADEKTMTKYVIGAISSVDAPLTPYSQGQRDFSIYITGLTAEDVQRERDEILNITVEDIRKLAPLVKSILSGNNFCVIGNENKIEECKEMFMEVKNIK